ncbi:solanesyl-diphosphate synthase 1, mitochondrial [Arachis ipaensis]|uniref:solanesyl-diphosphate synthase 1, mitochondrial n=1 Tax=Arachis ipaensis TaxID=130454 RepID=UPI000A2B45E8|nr:solanesyl-diphosphate synthase 1, mitochondrial [Arachis ipaensis]
MSFYRGLSRISRNLRGGGSFNGSRFRSLQFLASHEHHSSMGSAEKVRSFVFTKGLPALHSSRYKIHQQSHSISEDELDPFSMVADELSLVANNLRAMVVAEVPKLASSAEYFFRMGVEGKRFRPTVLLLMSTALNLSTPKPPHHFDQGGSVATDLRTRQQCIAEITEMIHVSPSENVLYGIVTAPILFAMEEFPQLRAVVDKGFDNPDNVDIALEYLGKSRGIQRTKDLAIMHANLAAAAIDSLPDSDDEEVKKSRRALVHLTQRVITRTK